MLMKTPPTEKLDDFHQTVHARHGCLRGCCLFVLVILVLIAGTTLWVVARSGLGTIPLVSGALYHVPTARVLIEPAPDQLDLLSERLETEAQDFTGGDVELTLSQEELTALARQKISGATVIVGGGTIEYFGPIEFPKFGKQIKLYVTVVLTPVVEDGRLHLALQKVKIGQLGIPAGLLDQIGQLVQKNLVDTNEFIKQITINTVTVGDGMVTLRGNIPPALFDQSQTSE